MANLDLPETAPTTKYNDQNHDCDKFAIYSLFDASRDKLAELERLLTQEENTKGTYSFEESTGFDKSVLRNVLNHHLQIADERKLNPTLFIAAHSEKHEEDGVLLVNLNFDLAGGVAKARVKASEALLDAIGLQIANIDWEEIESEDPPSPTKPSQDTAVHESDFMQFAVYGIKEEVEMYQACDLLEPGWTDTDPGESICELLGCYTDGPDPITNVIKHHPWRCMGRARLCKQWCICVDNADPAEEGVLLLHIKWDGNTNIDAKELVKVGPAAEIETERCDVITALAVLAAKARE